MGRKQRPAKESKVLIEGINEWKRQEVLNKVWFGSNKVMQKRKLNGIQSLKKNQLRDTGSFPS